MPGKLNVHVTEINFKKILSAKMLKSKKQFQKFREWVVRNFNLLYVCREINMNSN